MSVPSNAASPGVAGRRWLAVASTLCWLWGAVVLVVGIALLLGAVAGPRLLSGPFVVGVAFLLLALGYLYGGYGLRKQHSASGWVALGVAACTMILHFRNGITAAASVSLVVNLVIVGLVLANWRHLGSQSAYG